MQVTNIAPQATRDQMHTLFSFLGKIEDLRLYPSLRDASINIQSRVCFVKVNGKLNCDDTCLVIFKYSLFYFATKLVLLQFQEDGVMPTSLHMTNTVFIDRAIIVQVKYFLLNL